MPTLIDHALILVIAGLFPIYGLLTFPSLVRRIAQGDRAALRREYWEIMGWLWGFATLVVGYWLIKHRSLEALGFAITVGPGFWAAAGILAALTIAFIVQWVRVIKHEAYRETARKAFGKVGALIPRTRPELTHFAAVSMTAGICEELLFRGYLIWYIGQFLGVWPAAIISSLLFGYGHMYQGIAGVGKTAVAGFVAACLYLLSGSLWVPIVLHAALDLIQGATGYAALSNHE